MPLVNNLNPSTRVPLTNAPFRGVPSLNPNGPLPIITTTGLVQASTNPTDQQNLVTSSVVTPIVAPTTTTTIDNPFMDWLGLSSTPSAEVITGVPNLILAIGGIGLSIWALMSGKEKE